MERYPSVRAGNAAPATLLFYWDYDTQWGADRSRSRGGRKSWGMAEFENTDHLLELHEEYGVPACFAVVGAAALPGTRPYHDPQQIRRIHAAGHEIASHSFHHEWLPGLGKRRLRDTLHRSKDALEQCIGAPVRTFVPPYNQPFDYPGGWSFSLSERRRAGPDRIDLYRLCAELYDIGYRQCRVGYRHLYFRLLDRLAPRRLDGPVQAESIAGVTCVRINTPCGFGASTAAVVARCVERGGIAVVHAHPHSLRARKEQDERFLVPFLNDIHSLVEQRQLRICLPSQLCLLRSPDAPVHC